MSPTWPRILAARTAPRPWTWVRVVPVAASASRDLGLRCPRGGRSSAAQVGRAGRGPGRRRQASVAVTGRTPRSSAAALSADRPVGRRRGRRSRSSPWSRLRMRVRSRARSSRRSASSRRIVVWSSAPRCAASGGAGRPGRRWRRRRRRSCGHRRWPAAGPGRPGWPARPARSRRRRPAAGRWAAQPVGALDGEPPCRPARSPGASAGRGCRR